MFTCRVGNQVEPGSVENKHRELCPLHMLGAQPSIITVSLDVKSKLPIKYLVDEIIEDFESLNQWTKWRVQSQKLILHTLILSQ